jgi:hypothetical protein
MQNAEVKAKAETGARGARERKNRIPEHFEDKPSALSGSILQYWESTFFAK